jgi:electron transfer flavoprotein beta subunit
LKIIVLMKQVPDTYGARKLNTSTGRVDRVPKEAVPDEIGERALEVAMSYKDAVAATEVVVATMGPESALDTLRRGLAMGADSAIHILDDALAGSDLVATSKVIAAALISTGFDLVIGGNESTDGRGGVLPAMLAEHLGVGHATYLDDAEISSQGVTGHRTTDAGTAALRVTLPAVISVTDRTPEPRFPNFKGIMSAKKKPVSVLSLSDLGLAVSASSNEAHSVVLNITARPAKGAGTKIVDDGTAASQLVEFLTVNQLI